jgi:two-component system, LuxR family, response regulator FixJ
LGCPFDLAQSAAGELIVFLPHLRKRVRSMNAGDGATIVLIEDDAALQKSLRFALTADGYSVRVFGSGPELLAAIGVGQADGCLVIDYHLPEGINGVELLRSLRARQIMTPAILITSNPSPTLQEQAKTAGFFKIVEKPLLGDALNHGLQEAMSGGTASASV